MIRACLFDMGNVLLHFSHERMCRQIADLCQRPIAQVQEVLFGEQMHWSFDRGEISEQQFHQSLCRKLDVSVPIDELKHAASDIFELNQPIVPVLDQLQQLDVRLVLLSNTSSPHLEFIQRNYDVLERFDALAVSFEVQAIKPEEAIYRRAIELAGCEPAECFYTDDIENYVIKGRELGLQAEIFVGVEPLIRQLNQLGLRVTAE